MQKVNTLLKRTLLALAAVLAILVVLKWGFGYRPSVPVLVSALVVPVLLAAISAYTSGRVFSGRDSGGVTPFSLWLCWWQSAFADRSERRGAKLAIGQAVHRSAMVTA